MSTPQANTKIERAVEAIESLTLATVTAQLASGKTEKVHAFENVKAARAECAAAFREFLQPILRVAS